MENLFLTIIVPAFNEENHIFTSVSEAMQAASLANIDCEIIIVDDCSLDQTNEIACKLSQDDPRIKVIRNKKNLGLGGSYKAGLDIASGTHITWVPADESHPAEGLLSAYLKIGQADIIIPNPINPEVRGRRRRLISKSYTFLVNLLSGLNLPYFNGLSIHRLDLLREISLTSNGFGFQAEAIVKLVYSGASYFITDTIILERRLSGSKAFRLKNIFSVANGLAYILLLSIFDKLGRCRVCFKRSLFRLDKRARPEP